MSVSIATPERASNFSNVITLAPHDKEETVLPVKPTTACRRKLSMELAALDKKLVGRSHSVVSDVYKFCSLKRALGFTDLHVVMSDMGEYNIVLAKHSDDYQCDQVVYAELREGNVTRVRLLSMITPFCPAQHEERKFVGMNGPVEPLGGVAMDLFDVKDLIVNTLTMSADGFIYYVRREYRGGVFRYELESGAVTWCKVLPTVAAQPWEYKINWDRVTTLQAGEAGRLYLADDRMVFLLRHQPVEEEYILPLRTTFNCYPMLPVVNGQAEPVVGLHRIKTNSGHSIMRHCFGGKVYVGHTLVAQLDGSSRLCWLGGCHEILLQFSCANGEVTGYRLVDNCTRLSEQFTSVMPSRWCRSAEGIACVTPGGKVCILGVSPEWNSLLFEMTLEYRGGDKPECPVDSSAQVETLARRLRRYRLASSSSSTEGTAGGSSPRNGLLLMTEVDAPSIVGR